MLKSSLTSVEASAIERRFGRRPWIQGAPRAATISSCNGAGILLPFHARRYDFLRNYTSQLAFHSGAFRPTSF
jgi:hypothetical protein